jgi:hypothetical protein
VDEVADAARRGCALRRRRGDRLGALQEGEGDDRVVVVEAGNVAALAHQPDEVRGEPISGLRELAQDVEVPEGREGHEGQAGRAGVVGRVAPSLALRFLADLVVRGVLQAAVLRVLVRGEPPEGLPGGEEGVDASLLLQVAERVDLCVEGVVAALLRIALQHPAGLAHLSLVEEPGDLVEGRLAREGQVGLLHDLVHQVLAPLKELERSAHSVGPVKRRLRRVPVPPCPGLLGCEEQRLDGRLSLRAPRDVHLGAGHDRRVAPRLAGQLDEPLRLHEVPRLGGPPRPCRELPGHLLPQLGFFVARAAESPCRRLEVAALRGLLRERQGRLLPLALHLLATPRLDLGPEPGDRHPELGVVRVQPVEQPLGLLHAPLGEEPADLREAVAGRGLERDEEGEDGGSEDENDAGGGDHDAAAGGRFRFGHVLDPRCFTLWTSGSPISSLDSEGAWGI